MESLDWGQSEACESVDGREGWEEVTSFSKKRNTNRRINATSSLL